MADDSSRRSDHDDNPRRRLIDDTVGVVEDVIYVGISLLLVAAAAVLLSVRAADTVGTGAEFRDQMWEIGVLGAVVILLGVTAWMLRMKEREPDETGGDAAR